MGMEPQYGQTQEESPVNRYRTTGRLLAQPSIDRYDAAPKENSMRPMMSFRRGVGALAALVVLAGVVPVYAQTQGMERRDDRQDNRAGARAAKQACKAGDEKTRAECRQVKHNVKHGKAAPAAPAAGAAPAAPPAP